MGVVEKISDRAIRKLADRTRLDPYFFGHAIHRYAEANGLSSWEAVAERWQTDVEKVIDMALCRQPWSEKDVDIIAAKFEYSRCHLREIASWGDWEGQTAEVLPLVDVRERERDRFVD